MLLEKPFFVESVVLSDVHLKSDFLMQNNQVNIRPSSTNELPRVTVICLCYNHEKYVNEALESVFDQSYEDIQLIVVDDASADGSKEVISKVFSCCSIL